jgi:D-cysteine desulfhydrase
VLYLRVPDPAKAALGHTGNVLLDRLAGAEICFISPAEYKERESIMDHARQALASEGVSAYVVPEGGSNGLGALGYVAAMHEVRRQLDLGLCGSLAAFDVVAHACGSGGTAAGVALGAARFGVAAKTWSACVCDDAAYFERVVARIVAEARAFDPSLSEVGIAKDALVFDERAKGPAYAVMDDDQKRFLVEVARASGVILDPVYTGKALWSVAQATRRGDIAPGATLLFLHTGGLPGLLAQGDELAGVLESHG